jgi:hypothetical protein
MLEFKEILKNEENVFNDEENERPREIQYRGDEILYHSYCTIASRIDNACIHCNKRMRKKMKKRKTRIINCILNVTCKYHDPNMNLV